MKKISTKDLQISAEIIQLSQEEDTASQRRCFFGLMRFLLVVCGTTLNLESLL